MILHHRSLSADHEVGAKADARTHHRTDAQVAAIPQDHIPGQAGPGPQVAEVSNAAAMGDRGVYIQEDMPPDLGVGFEDRPRHQDGTGANGTGRAHHGRGMDEYGMGHPLGFQEAGETLSDRRVPDRQDRGISVLALIRESRFWKNRAAFGIEGDPSISSDETSQRGLTLAKERAKYGPDLQGGPASPEYP